MLQRIVRKHSMETYAPRVFKKPLNPSRFSASIPTIDICSNLGKSNMSSTMDVEADAT